MKVTHGLFALTVVSMLLACGGGDDKPSTASGTTDKTPVATGAPSTVPPAGGTPAATTASDGTLVEVSGASFTPATVTIKVGERVKWVWKGGRHNVVSGANCSPDGKFTSGPVAGPPTTFEQTFTQPGTYEYYCDPHCGMGMTGTVVVQ